MLKGEAKEIRDFFGDDTPTFGWVLVSEPFRFDTRFSSHSDNYFTQTLGLAEKLEKSFPPSKMPKIYQEALDELSQYKEKNFKDMSLDNINTATDIEGPRFTEELPELKINRLLRPSPADLVYQAIVRFESNSYLGLSNFVCLTQKPDQNDGISALYYLGSSSGGSYQPFSAANRHSDNRIIFCRKF